ncbi:MAG: Ig-like domain-containing protein, partial [Oscillibacter sp.]|nr:Ig-like domain-containing protein [Oscillibacter sp.]
GAKFYSSSTTGNIEVKMSKGNAVVNPTGVTVELASSSIYVGNQTTATARVTPDNATDKSVTWSSSNTSVATIVGGRITGVAAGTATITARTSNGITGSATITVGTPAPTRHEFHTDFEYDFLNSGSSFGYGPNYKIPQVRFEQVGYTPRQAASIYNASSRESKNAYWGGSCFGFSSSSVLFYKDILQEENYDPNVHVPHGFRAPSGNSAYDVKLRSMIELMQLSQPFWNETYSAPRQDFNPQRIATELDNDNPVVLSIGLIYNLRAGGHAVVIYGYDRDSSGNYTFYIYDNSTFVESVTCSSSGRYVRGSGDFRFQVSSRMASRVREVWPTGFYTLESIRTIYDTLKRENHSGAANLLDVNDQRYVYIFCPVGDATIQNSAGDTAVIRDSELSGDDLNLELILPTFSMDEDENSTETRYYTIVAPEDTYRITPAEGNLTVVGVDMSVDVSTDATPDTSAEAEPLITISSDLCTVSLDTEDGNNYYVNYYVYNSRFDTLSVSGTAAEYVSASLKADLNRVDVEGARNITAEAIVGGKSSRVQGSAGFGQDSLPFSVTWSAPEEGESDLRIDQNLNSESLNFSALVEDEDLNDVSKMPMGGPVDDDWESTPLNTREQLNPPTFDFRRNSDNTWEVTIEVPNDVTVIYYTTDESDPGTTDPRTIDAELRQTYGGVPILVAPNT